MYEPALDKNGQTIPCPGCQKPLLMTPWGPCCADGLADRVKPQEPKAMSYFYHQALYGLHQNPRKCGSEGRYQFCNALN